MKRIALVLVLLCLLCSCSIKANLEEGHAEKEALRNSSRFEVLEMVENGDSYCPEAHPFQWYYILRDKETGTEYIYAHSGIHGLVLAPVVYSTEANQ